MSQTYYAKQHEYKKHKKSRKYLWQVHAEENAGGDYQKAVKPREIYLSHAPAISTAVNKCLLSTACLQKSILKISTNQRSG